MKTFIALTFGFLGLAFYEMSGGGDFEPASARLDANADTALIASATAAPAPKSATSETALTIAPEPTVTRASLNLSSVDDSASESIEQTKITAPAPQAQKAVYTLDKPTFIDSSQTEQIILPSLIATTPQVAAAPEGEIRTVSGNRVNVRGGPGTNHGVVGKLGRGEEVRILDDNGDGWVLMESVNGGAEGWMADFLLTES